ncbi:transcription factor GTE2-like [Wolffia australiana]
MEGRKEIDGGGAARVRSRAHLDFFKNPVRPLPRRRAGTRLPSLPLGPFAARGGYYHFAIPVFLSVHRGLRRRPSAARRRLSSSPPLVRGGEPPSAGTDLDLSIDRRRWWPAGCPNPPDPNLACFPIRRPRPCMASALLASSRDEPFWGEPNLYMRKTPCSNPNPNSMLASDNRGRDRLRAAPASSPFPDRGDDPASGCYDAAPAASDDSSSSDHRKIAGRRHVNKASGRRDSGFDSKYVTFDIGSYSRRELQQLKRRLISELEQVRSLGNRINSGDVQPARSACFSTTGYGGGGGGGREVTSAPAISPPKGGAHHALAAAESPTTGGERNSLGKRSLASPSSRDAKRPSSGDAMMKKCAQILTKLMKHRHGWVFNTPVDVMGLGLHDYYQIVRRPMDLGSVKSKLVDRSCYASASEFAGDVRLTFNNALLYNPEGHDVHKMAGQLLNLFEKLFADACRGHESQAQPFGGKMEEEEARGHARPASEPPRRSSPGPLPQARPPPPSVPPPPLKQSSPPTRAEQVQAQPVAPARAAPGKQPKPKAKEPNKREMSFEEKKKLSQGLQSLPEEKMTQVLLIVQRRNPDPALHGDEIELDFETLDTETLWELDRFVGNCRKMMSKVKRMEAMSTAAPAPDAPAPEQSEPAATMEEATEASRRVGKKGGEVGGEEDVDIGEEEMPSAQFSPVEIDKDSGNQSESSSSSGSSGSDSSSSSDSDSRSSAESEDLDADDAQSPAVG